MSNQLLSEEMRATADALRQVRRRLIQMIAEDQLPEWAVADASTVQVIGLDVAMALERLAQDKRPTYLDERR